VDGDGDAVGIGAQTRRPPLHLSDSSVVAGILASMMPVVTRVVGDGGGGMLVGRVRVAAWEAVWSGQPPSPPPSSLQRR
jgi:hypothetical protein